MAIGVGYLDHRRIVGCGVHGAACPIRSCSTSCERSPGPSTDLDHRENDLLHHRHLDDSRDDEGRRRLAFGPAFFSTTQDLPTSVTVTEPGPTVDQASGEMSESGVGFHLAVDAPTS